MKNEQQSQNLLLKVDQRSTFRNTFLQPATNVFVAGEVDRTRWNTGNIDDNLRRNNVARQVEGFCMSYFAALSELKNNWDFRLSLAKRPENTALENVDELLITNGFINQAKINVFTADILEGKSLL